MPTVGKERGNAWKHGSRMERGANFSQTARHAFITAQFKAVRILGDAASYFVKHVEPSGNLAGVLHLSNVLVEGSSGLCRNLCTL
jgi:hypothetical protein